MGPEGRITRARAAHMMVMTHTDAAAARRENARDKSTGRFGTQEHTAPELTITAPVSVEETTYGVYADGELVSAGVKGAGMEDAIHRAHVWSNGHQTKAGEPLPTITVRCETSGKEVRVPYADEGRIVGWFGGVAITAEEMDERGVSLTMFDKVDVEPYIDLGPYKEGDLPAVEKWLRDADFQVGSVYAQRDDETGGRHIDVSMYENFLWNADTQCPDDEFEDDSDLDPDDDRPASVQRYERWLDDNRDIVEQVYLEWFNADIDTPDSWEYATVTIRKTVPYERFTESLVLEDIYEPLATYSNRVDPGTFMSPYVMGEVRRRVEKRDTLRALIAERDRVAGDGSLPIPTQNAQLRNLDNEIGRLEREGVTA